jgi:hypothetical protein
VSLTPGPELASALQRLANEELWKRGDLVHKLRGPQVKIYEAIKSAPQSYYLLCSRRLGKTHTLVTVAFEMAIQRPGARILYLAPQAKDAAEIAGDIALQILDDCPAHLRPDFKAQIKEFHFPNGSIIRLKGTNGEHAQYLRGGAADLVILDECGLMDDLRHVYLDVVLPMTMTTGGKILFATTPSRSPGHEAATIYEDHARTGQACLFTILDNDRLTDDKKTQYLVAAGENPDRVPAILRRELPPESITARREYFCEWLTDAASQVFPEWNELAVKEMVKRVQPPPFYDCYVAMDPGMQDRTGILFGYVDFRAGKLVIQDELLLSAPNTATIAKEIKAKEQALWGDKSPFLRVTDIDLRLIADLYAEHSLVFTKTQKVDSLGAINLSRTMLHNREVVIDPRCQGLIRQLKNAVWNKAATDFDRADLDGHFDLAAAFKYMCRSVLMTKNPYPSSYFGVGGPGGPAAGSFVSPKLRGKPQTQQLDLLSNTPFGRKVQKRKR